MTPDQIEQMAREAGGMRLADGPYYAAYGDWVLAGAELTRFAQAVRAAALEEYATGQEMMELKRKLSKANSAFHGCELLLRAAQDRFMDAEEKLATARASALAEAAKVCEAERVRLEPVEDECVGDGCNFCATAIRALAQQAGGEQGGEK